MYHIIAHLWIAKFIAILLFAILGLQFIRYNTVPAYANQIKSFFLPQIVEYSIVHKVNQLQT